MKPDKQFPTQSLIPVPRLAVDEMLFEVEAIAVKSQISNSWYCENCNIIGQPFEGEDKPIRLPVISKINLSAEI